MNPIKNIYSQYYRSGLGWIIIFVVIVVLHKFTSIISPIIVQRLIDSFTTQHSKPLFLNYCTYFIVVTSLFVLLLVLRNLLENKISIDASTQLKLRILEKIPRLKSKDLDNLSLGYFLQLINDDVDNTSSLIVNDFTVFICNIFYTFFVVFYMIRTNVLLSIIVLLIYPIFIFSSRILIPKLQAQRNRIIDSEQALNNVVEETFDGADEIKIFKGYDILKNKATGVLNKLQFHNKKYVKFDTLYDFLFTTGLLNLGNVLVYIVGGYLALQGDITVGGITLFILYFSQLWNCIESFQLFFKNYKVKLISVNRINNILVTPDEFFEQNGSDKIALLSGLEQLTLSHVSFSYHKNIDLLNDINLTINKRDRIGILGANGSGKSTIARLLVNILEPVTGEIRYNNVSYRDIGKEAIRDKVILLSAEPFIFEGNLEDNFVDPVFFNASGSLINTNNIDFKGKNLSSGEKKFLQLMRSKSKKPELVIFDEPLNYIDETKKGDFIHYIKNETSNITVILISHDISILKECNCIYKLENGTLVNV